MTSLALGLAALGFTACTSMSSTALIEASTRFEFTSFDGPGGGATTVNGMNDDGDVVGFTTTTTGSATVNTNFVRHPDGTFTTLSIGDPAASANGISDAGRITFGVAL